MNPFVLNASVLALAVAVSAGCVTVERTERITSPEPSAAVVTTTPGTTVVTVPTIEPNCGGAYAPPTGTNFGACVSPAR